MGVFFLEDYIIKIGGKFMDMISILNKKRKGEALKREEIDFVISSYVSGSIPDYQMSALLMAITIKGMSDEETFYLCDAMLRSGERLDLSDISGTIIDKHSTGGVGDKTTLVLGPLMASCGMKMAKLSGRGLGFTGGTIDKLESIPGFSTKMTLENFKKQVNDIGFVLVSQMENLVPADKLIYALRDVTGTVESIPLIASSIMSKKIASSASFLILDVKVGEGALMKTEEDALKFANLMIKIGKRYGRKVICVLTSMDEPLGYAIGNALEVKEAISMLKNEETVKDFYTVVMEIASLFLVEEKGISKEEALKFLEQEILSFRAYEAFKRFVEYQGGDLTSIKKAPFVVSLKSIKEGYIEKIHALKLGELARCMGAGRLKKEDSIEPEVGFLLKKKVGDYVKIGEELIEVHMKNIKCKEEDVLSCFEIGSEKVCPKQIITILK